MAVLGGTLPEMQDVSQCCDAHFWIIIINSVNTSFDIAEIRLGTTELCHPRSEMSKRERSGVGGGRGSLNVVSSFEPLLQSNHPGAHSRWAGSLAAGLTMHGLCWASRRLNVAVSLRRRQYRHFQSAG